MQVIKIEFLTTTHFEEAVSNPGSCILISDIYLPCSPSLSQLFLSKSWTQVNSSEVVLITGWHS